MSQSASDKDVHYYSILNVDLHATEEEIRNSYRRLCLVYHPDKQNFEPEEADKKREIAERNFHLIQKAYDVLSDSNQRYIYDKFGVEGLEHCWTVGTPLGQAEEIKMRIERNQRLQKEQQEDSGWTLRSTMATELDASKTFGMDAYAKPVRHVMDRVPEFSSLVLSQGVEKWVDEISSTVTLDCRTSVQKDSGSSSCSAQIKRALGEGSTGVLAAGWGGTSYLSSQYHRALGKWTTVDLLVVGYFQRRAMYPAYHVTMTRVLAPHAVGAMKYSFGIMPALTLILNYEPSQSTTLHTNLKLSRYELASQLRLKYVPMLSKYDFKARLGASTNEGLSALIGGSRHVTELTSALWALELSTRHTGLVAKFGFSRKQFKLVVPIILSHACSLRALTMSSLLMSGLCYLIETMILDPIQKAEERKEVEEFERDMAKVIFEKKVHALEAISLMEPQVHKKIETEKLSQGLIIVEALYGDLATEQTIDVRIPLQMLVVNSQLVLSNQSKVYLMGFYDPCVARAKQLYVRYLFRDRWHTVTVEDKESLSIPKREHFQYWDSR